MAFSMDLPFIFDSFGYVNTTIKFPCIPKNKIVKIFSSQSKLKISPWVVKL